jgi:hypothetical protein
MIIEECLIVTCMSYSCQGVSTIYFQVTQETSQLEQQPPSSAAEERLTRGRMTRSNSAANSGAVYTTAKQLKETAARKRYALSKKNTQVLCETFYLSLH